MVMYTVNRQVLELDFSDHASLGSDNLNADKVEFTALLDGRTQSSASRAFKEVAGIRNEIPLAVGTVGHGGD
jgi:archaellum component FlaG (FlaF/FlaG flagellin family)